VLRKELENVCRKLSSVEEEYRKKCVECEAVASERDVADQQAAQRQRDLERALETTNAQLCIRLNLI